MVESYLYRLRGSTLLMQLKVNAQSCASASHRRDAPLPLRPRGVGARPLPTPSARAALNLQLVRGVLLHGPPGTGKSLTARKIGALLGVPEERTTVVDGPALVSKFLGERLS